MIRSIFVILVICIIITFGCFFVKGHYGFDALENFDIDKITGALTQDTFLKDKTHKKDSNFEENKTTTQPQEDETSVYFLKTNGESAKLESTKKEFSSDSDKFRAAIEALFSGPSRLEKIAGVYSEIPANTKLLGIKEDNIPQFISKTNEILKDTSDEPVYFVDYIYDGESGYVEFSYDESGRLTQATSNYFDNNFTCSYNKNVCTFTGGDDTFKFTLTDEESQDFHKIQSIIQGILTCDMW